MHGVKGRVAFINTMGDVDNTLTPSFIGHLQGLLLQCSSDISELRICVSYHGLFRVVHGPGSARDHRSTVIAESLVTAFLLKSVPFKLSKGKSLGARLAMK